VDLTDVSAEALETARANAEALGVSDRVRLLPGDLFEALAPEVRYQVITANPPYIAEVEREKLPPDVVEHEPHVALFGGSDGLEVIRRIAAGAAARLAPGGTLLIEVGAGQAGAAREVLSAAGFATVRTHKDLAGIERVVEAC
jgi:release factor glutamine methyltransferase